MVLPLASAPGMPEAGEHSLVERARAGSRRAFGTLYENYARMVHGILLARVPPDEVEDLLQQVFLIALSRIAGLRDTEAFGGWLAAIARNQAIEFHRHKRAHAELRDWQLKQYPAPPEALGALDAIRSLPEAYRETLVLRLVEGMTGPEIARQTGLTPDSVRVNLHRGFKVLREKIQGEQPG